MLKGLKYKGNIVSIHINYKTVTMNVYMRIISVKRLHGF